MPSHTWEVLDRERRGLGRPAEEAAPPDAPPSTLSLALVALSLPLTVRGSVRCELAPRLPPRFELTPCSLGGSGYLPFLLTGRDDGG